jgi:hypothetical protein
MLFLILIATPPCLVHTRVRLVMYAVILAAGRTYVFFPLAQFRGARMSKIGEDCPARLRHTSRTSRDVLTRRWIVTRICSALLLIAAAFWIGSRTIDAQVCKTCPSYEKAKSPEAKKLADLVGCWSGKGPNSLAVKALYELGSDKTALLEQLSVEKNPTMYTMYYLDGETQVAHHFCSYGNQLRMRAVPSEPDTLLFKFVDGSNLTTATNHMTYIKFIFNSHDRFEAVWGLQHDGKETPQPFTFGRVMQGCTARSTNDW